MGLDIYRQKEGESEEVLVTSDISEAGSYADNLGRSSGTYHYIIKDDANVEVIRKTVTL